MMAQIIYSHPGLDKHVFHVFTNLDFWDARKVLKGLAAVKRNFGDNPSGRRYPTQVVAEEADRKTVRAIERRLERAVPSPPRHVVVEEVLKRGTYAFDPKAFYPARWSRERMIHFTRFRLPLNQPPLETPHFEVILQWEGDRLRAERVRRKEKHDPVIQTREEQRRRRFAPACF